MSVALARVLEIAGRLTGVDIKHRKHGTNWPAPWRVRLLTSKNERAHLRLTCFGSTLEAACEALLAAVAAADRQVEKATAAAQWWGGR